MAEAFLHGYTGFVGTASTGGSRGIYRIRLNAATGEIHVLDTMPMYHAGYLTISKDRRNLYVLSEGMTFKGRASGGITAYDISDGKFEELNWAVTGGQRPCFVYCDDNSAEIYVSNFYQGTMAAFRRQDDGRIGERLACVKAHDTTPVGPFLHCVMKSPAGRYLAALEVIGGSIYIYDCENQYRLVWKEELEAHSGPRHMVFSEDGRFLYVNRQDDEKVSVYYFAPDSKRILTHVQTISVRTPDMKGKTEPAAIRLCPGGRLLAVSNRGMGRENREDSISIYGVDTETGRITLISVIKTEGEMPRDINFTPDGKFLVVAYQFQGYPDLFRVEGETLIYTGAGCKIPSPVCIAF